MASRLPIAIPSKGIARFAWHRLLIIFFTLSLCACENISELSELKKAAELSLFGNPDIAIERADIDKLPYASIRAKMGRSGRVIMILGRYDGPDLHWISADSVAVATRRGRIVKSSGLPETLKTTIYDGLDPIGLRERKWNAPIATRRFIDIEPGAHYGVTVVGKIEQIGVEEIEILGHRYQTIVLRERAYAAQLDWSFENYFWLDIKTGFVWKSIQHITPSLPPFEIEILKPAG
jgi:hypothetical protein